LKLNQPRKALAKARNHPDRKLGSIQSLIDPQRPCGTSLRQRFKQIEQLVILLGGLTAGGAAESGG